MTQVTHTFGGHNLHDDAGVPTFFADVLIFNEAIAHTIRAKAAQRVAHSVGRLAGFGIQVCGPQPDLVVAWRRRLFHYKGHGYTKYVDGWAKVTPNRGTFVVYLEHRETGQLVAVVAEHRINAAFPPYVRSQGSKRETRFRIRSWEAHTAGTLGHVDWLKDSGYVVLAGVDLNVPKDISGYQTHLHEVGPGVLHFDRLGCSATIGGLEVLSNADSDHPRVRATVTWRSHSSS